MIQLNKKYLLLLFCNNVSILFVTFSSKKVYIKKVLFIMIRLINFVFTRRSKIKPFQKGLQCICKHEAKWVQTVN